MALTRYPRLADLATRVGRELARSDALNVDQARIDAFAHATGDLQWIHVDPLRAAQGPFGTTIAHGFLTLSLLPTLMHSAFAIDDVRVGINYGVNRLLRSFEPIEGGAQLVIEAVVTRDGHDKPVCVVEQVVRQFT